ncbi:uncharacterized protein PG998_013996 [Apiospora kogelbergensis]|uniref:uncharacterized protein n=1 Tax=Apiospora kogelbergensis TaxID=1337665 RepID=UPI00313190B6
MSDIPLKVRIGIRDSWASEDAPVRKSLAKLRELLGLDVAVEPEWPLLLAALNDAYPDKQGLVPVVAQCVRVWADVLVTVLQDEEANEEWIETLLDRAGGLVRLYLEVQSSKSEDLRLSWSNDRTGFVIVLPRGQMPYVTELEAALRGQLLDCFKKDSDVASQSVTLASQAAAQTDDWADVSLDAATGKAAVVEDARSPQRYVQPAKAAHELLPDVGILARPDDLLLKPPYHLVVYDRGSNEVEVHGSHSPSLQFLSEYLKKWCRINQQNHQKPPCVEIKLHQSAFGLGLIYDRLTLSVDRPYSQYGISPMIVLSLVEGVLGYQNAGSEASCWRFRREVELKKYGS